MTDVLDIVTIGWLTRDDIVLTDGDVRRNVPGGGALYSAVGAQIWVSRVGIHAVAGRSAFDEIRAAVDARGIDGSGIGSIQGDGLQLWLLHEGDAAKQQLPKLGSAVADDLDRSRGPLPAAYANARGFHVAPQTPAGSLESVRQLRGLSTRPAVTFDLLSDEFIDRRLYADLSFLDGVMAFLPSEAEVHRIWRPPDLRAWMVETAREHGCHVGVKCGASGSLVYDARRDGVVLVPAYPTEVLDTTGAGDAFCGGFLAGLVGGHDVVTCSAMGTVSASYVIEACGALQTRRPAPEDRDARVRSVLERSSPV